MRLPWQRMPGPWMWEPTPRRRFAFPNAWTAARRTGPGWALLGLAVGVSLVVFCRDAVQASMGVELAWVAAMSIWLLGLAAGAALSCLAPVRALDPARAAFGMVAACMPLYALYFMRAACSMAGIAPGGQLGLGWALWNLAVTVGATGLFVGCHVSLTVRAGSDPRRAWVAASVGVAGLGAASLLGPLGLQPFILASLSALCYVTGAALLQGQWLPLYAAVAALLAWSPAVGLMRSIDVISLLPRYALLAHRGVTYGLDGQVALAAVAGRPTLLVDGQPHLRLGDNLAAQELAHVTMVQHPAPAQVLVVGGLGGALAEALKHPVVAVTDLEVEPRAREVAERVVSVDDKGALYDRRVTVVTADPRAFVEASPGRFDVILIAASMPPTLAGGRLQSLEFYQAVRRALKPGGVMGVTVSPISDIHDAESWLRDRSILDAVRAAFPCFMALPLSSNHAVASERPLEDNPVVWLGTVRLRGVATSFLTPESLGLALRADRFSDATAALAAGVPRPALDARPLAFRLAPTFGVRTDRSLLANLLRSLRGPGPWLPALVAVLCALGVVLLAARLTPIHETPPPRDLDSPWYTDDDLADWPEPEPRMPLGVAVRALGAPAAAAAPVAVHASLVVVQAARESGSVYLILPAALAAALCGAGAGAMLTVRSRWPGRLAAVLALGALAAWAFAPPVLGRLPLLGQLGIWVGGSAALAFLAGLAAAGSLAEGARFEALVASIAASAGLAAFTFTYVVLPRWTERWSLVSMAGAWLFLLLVCLAAPRGRARRPSPVPEPVGAPTTEPLTQAAAPDAALPDPPRGPDAAPAEPDQPQPVATMEKPE